LPIEKTVESRNIYRGRALSLRIDAVEMADGRRTSREIVEHSPGITVVPLDGDGNVLMVRQYRKPVEQFLLELPAGGIEAGESPEEAATRELQEEIGFVPRLLEPMGGAFLAPGYSSEYLHYFLALDLAPGRLTAEDTAEIEVVKVPLNDIPARIASGEICDAKSIAGLLRFICLGRKD
jgi:ADP-ribose pyrophosphatase